MKTEVERSPAPECTHGVSSAFVVFPNHAGDASEELGDMATAAAEIRKHVAAVEFAVREHHADVVWLLNEIRRGEHPPTSLLALDAHTGRLLGAIEQLAAGAREFERALRALGVLSSATSSAEAVSAASQRAGMNRFTVCRERV